MIALPPILAAQVTLTVSATAPAENMSKRQLTLEDARQLALSNNKGLALARLSVQEKRYARTAARTDYFPKLLGNVTYFHFNDTLGSVVTAPTGKFGILPAGGVTRDVPVLNQDTSLGTILLAQPITKLIAVNAAVQAARADENAAQAQLDKGTRDLLSGITQAYHGLLGAQRIEAALTLQVKVLEQALALKPAPQLRIGLVEARQGLVQLRGQVRELTDQLNNLLDLPPETVLELIDPVPADLPVKSAGDAARLALENNPEVREAQQTIAKAEAGLQVARMDYLPDVNLVGGYANQTGASYVQSNIGYFGVTANYMFWGWGKRREVTRQRQTQVALAQQNLEVIAAKVQLEARKAFAGFEQARDGYRLAGEMVQARKDAAGAAAGAAAAQAQADTARAELEYMKAEITYRVAHAQLAGLVGGP